jgi:hypothetical protein
MACPNSSRPRKARQAKSKVKSMLIIYFDIKVIVHKEFILAGEKSFPYTTVMFYGDCLKMCEYFTLNFGYRNTVWCISTAHRLTLPLSPWNVLPKTT